MPAPMTITFRGRMESILRDVMIALLADGIVSSDENVVSRCKAQGKRAFDFSIEEYLRL